MTSCFKERKCDKIDEDYAPRCEECQKAIAIGTNEVEKAIDVWGVGSPQYNSCMSQLLRVQGECEEIMNRYNQEKLEAGCPN